MALYSAGSLAAHSGATVRDFHPLPFSPARRGENLGAVPLLAHLSDKLGFHDCSRMKAIFRATAPADRIQLSELLAEAFDVHSAAGSLLNPTVMAWKYWDARDDWDEPRSYALERDGRLIAHAALWPLIFPGEHSIRGIQMIDWCAAKDSPGVGLTLVQKLASLFDFMYSIGGSDMTLKVLPAFGFVETTQVWTAARSFHGL